MKPIAEDMNFDEGIRHCEELIKKIKDVASAKIITDADGAISEIHVISGSKRNPRQIVRDIESTLVASLGSQVDHKKISIAQIGEEDDFKAETRLKIEGLSIAKSRNGFEATVTLSGPDEVIYEGKCTGVGSLSSNMRTVALATLDAVLQFLKAAHILAVEDVTLFNLGNKESVAILVTFISAGGEEHFVGSAIIKDGVFDAVVAAVLNAINRRIGFIMKQITV